MSHFLTSLLVVLVFAVTAVCAESPSFKIVTKRNSDRVDVMTEKTKVTFTVRSPFGISSAVIERMADKWPEAVVLRLHLKGLENFQLSHDKVTVAGAVSSHDAKVRLWKDRKEDVPLDAKSPFWMDVRLIDATGKPSTTIPLKNGYFEMKLPKAFFETNPKTITFTWIDFYRG